MKAAAYVCYLTDPELHSNAAPTHAGIGDTKEEAQAAACYYANQWPWVYTVPISKAPRWAVEEAERAREEAAWGEPTSPLSTRIVVDSDGAEHEVICDPKEAR